MWRYPTGVHVHLHPTLPTGEPWSDWGICMIISIQSQEERGKMKTPRLFVVLPLVGIAALAAACSSGASSSTVTSTTAAQFKVESKYVALGSSYAAGPGVPTQSGGACARSSGNYPSLVAAKLHLALVDVSCSGATTANVLTLSQGTNAPQLDAVTSDTSLVTFKVSRITRRPWVTRRWPHLRSEPSTARWVLLRCA